MLGALLLHGRSSQGVRLHDSLPLLLSIAKMLGHISPAAKDATWVCSRGEGIILGFSKANTWVSKHPE
jgi:hypothetical protein